VLTNAGADVRVDLPDQVLHVTGVGAARVGDLAAEHAIALHELSPQTASLEEAFMELTRDSVDFRAEDVA